MKKISSYLIVAIGLTIFSISSCTSNKPKEVTLKNMNDSINYTLGHWQGDVMRLQVFGEDSAEELDAFIQALDKAYAEKTKSEMYVLGVQVGKYFKDQIENGFFGDSTLTGNVDLVMTGLVNALNDYQEVVTSTEADSIVQAVQMKSHARMYGQPNN
ncbi:MAG: FKBP-type peptidyl-prolyl cis-trans isomerase N-terminal domain-containing protein [Paludibacter sp.]|jgi:hypothetical protein|nr:hypothetical protein [Bacteroidales bacterium]HOG04840.1 FKBP-type peptidyl-prolyl cis-trans isomerase N-terminal domain-containing protein [Paludibacter sp.]